MLETPLFSRFFLVPLDKGVILACLVVSGNFVRPAAHSASIIRL